MRWIKNTRRAQQRLSLCKAVVTLSGPVRTTAEMSDDLRDMVTHEFAVSGDPDMVAWIKQKPGTMAATVEGESCGVFQPGGLQSVAGMRIRAAPKSINPA